MSSSLVIHGISHAARHDIFVRFECRNPFEEGAEAIEFISFASIFLNFYQPIRNVALVSD